MFSNRKKLKSLFKCPFVTTKKLPLLNNAAFTLIELLVVVLIIGILAAIAWPKYQVAVMRAKIVSTLPLLKAIAQAEYRHKLATGSYTNYADALDITIPGDCSVARCQVGNNLLDISIASRNIFLMLDTSIDTYSANKYYLAYYLEGLGEGGIGGVKIIAGDLICVDSKNNTVFSKACQTFSPIASERNSGMHWLIRGI
jgi:prepilin-type N-terminal cleavage/methylation domain-containing protein